MQYSLHLKDTPPLLSRFFTASLSSKLLFMTLSLTPLAFASANEMLSSDAQLDTINQTHVNLKADAVAQPFWSAEQKQQAELESKYLKAIEADPNNKKNYAYLAGLYLTNNKTGKAIEAYQNAIIHDPENPKLFAAISIAYLHHSRFDMAKAMVDQALRLDPEMKQVEKINEYIVAKQEAIEVASKIPATASSASSNAGHGAGHGAGSGTIIPNMSASKPKDAIHNPLK